MVLGFEEIVSFVQVLSMTCLEVDMADVFCAAVRPSSTGVTVLCEVLVPL